jgi:hypothetical protein
MLAFPLAILALAAGVYLLIQVKQSGLSPLYKNLSWLVIILSLLFMLGGVARGVMHIRHHRMEAREGHWGMRHGGPGMDRKMPSCCMSGMGSNSCCMPGSAGPMGHSSCDMKADGAMPACCRKDGKAMADSTAKK